MARRLMGKDVPEEMHRMAAGIVARGGRAFIANPEGMGEGDCANCNGWGHFILQHVVGGPFSSAPGGGGKGGSAAFIGDAWYLLRNDQFNCPDCLGNGKARRSQQPQPEKQPIYF